jgi:hypothetical protein
MHMHSCNEHSLQHHNAHGTAEEEGTHKSFPHNKTTQKQKVDGTYSAELQAQTELPGLGQTAAPHASGGWLDTAGAGFKAREERGVASTQFSTDPRAPFLC